jgi:glycopeptide antibiotics resistance protein
MKLFTIEVIMGCILGGIISWFVYESIIKNEPEKKYKISVQIHSNDCPFDCDSVSNGIAYKDGVKIKIGCPYSVTFN